MNFSIPTAPIKRKIFFSYHHGGDQAYYDALSTLFHDQLNIVTDNSLERRVDSDNAEYVMRRIRENYLVGSSCTVVLCGPNTPYRKYVDWEVEASLAQQMGLVGVWLPTLPLGTSGGTDKLPRLQDNIDSGYAAWVSWQSIQSNPHALTHAIEQALAQPKHLIVNNRARRMRNG